jgi:NADH dehydrogenase
MFEDLPHIVIVGAGFGGLRAARALASALVRVTVVDRRNYHLFQPLLYQVATAGLEAEEIAYPVRAILRRQRNAKFRLAEVRSIDFEAHKLSTSTGELTYDYLILAPGGATNYFGIGSVERSGLGLKSIEEAVAIRDQVLRQFELGVQQTAPEVRRAMLTFVVVGGGPTGVEVSGMLSELIRLVLTKDFPELDFEDVRVILLEASQRLLAGFPRRLSEATAEILSRKHVEVRLGATVTRFDGEKVGLEGGEVIPARTLIWAAGARAASLADRLGLKQGPLGRIRVDATLRALDQERVFAIGDAAYVESETQPLPMMAPVAIQQGALAGRNIERALRGEPLVPFVYRDPGSLATIGRNSAVARLGRFCFKGFSAWVLWLIVHLIQLIGFRNRLLVLINWAWDYFLYERAVRLVSVGAPELEEGRQRARGRVGGLPDD